MACDGRRVSRYPQTGEATPKKISPVRLGQLAAPEVATDQLTVSEALDKLDAVGHTAAANDVQHVGGGQDFVITAADQIAPVSE